MLHVNKSRLTPEQGLPVSEFASPAELYAAIIGFVRRQYSAIVFTLLFILALGAVYLFTAAPRYTGHAVLVIDTHKTHLFQEQSPSGDVPIDSATVDTQIEILKSENIALSVIKDLHLNEDPEFNSSGGGFVGTVVGVLANVLTFGIPLTSQQEIDEPSPEFRLTRTALEAFQKRLLVKRVGLTYAVEIDFKSLNPDRAAQIVNAVADAYVVDALDAKYQTTRRAAVWLQDRLKELREESSNAERAVVDYKAKNNIVDTGGRLMNEQQLAELNSAQIQARAQTAEAKARLDRVEQIVQAGDVDPAAAATGTVTDTLHNDVITKLREQYLEYDARASDWAKKYGATHLAVINLQDQMRELRRNIFQELQRTAESYKSDYEIAKTREDSVQKSLDKIIADSQTTNEAEVTLHNLESSSETDRSLYDNFLQRYMESVQQQSFPVSDARLITSATRPLGKSSPKALIVLAVAALGGLVLGIGVGALRDISDRVFRTTDQTEKALQAGCISVVPLVKSTSRPIVADVKVDGYRSTTFRTIVPDQSMLWTAMNSPFSRFAESIRAVKVAADMNNIVKASKVIGITSSLPNEGKSTIAVALVELIAHGGGRAVLVDCDLRNPSLSRTLAREAKMGILELIAGRASLDEVLWIEPASRFSFLPAVIPSRLSHSSEILASEALQKVFDKLREAYDYVIVDLSPLAPVVDVRAMTHLVDSFVFVVEWGRTKIDVAEHALSGARGVHENLLGIVLNKVDMNVLGRYESYRGNYYYNRYYARYGYTD